MSQSSSSKNGFSVVTGVSLGAMVAGVAAAGFGLSSVEAGPVALTGSAVLMALGLAGFAFEAGKRRALPDPLTRAFAYAEDRRVSPLLILNAAGEALFVNDAFRRLFPVEGGLTLESLAAQVAIEGPDREGGEGGAALMALRLGARDGAAGSADVAFDFGGDRPLWRRLLIDPVPESDLQVWQAIDIDAEIEQKRQASQEQAFLSRLLDGLPAAFFAVNDEGNLIYANTALRRWLGLTRLEVKAGRVAFADFVDPDMSRPAGPGDGGELMLVSRSGDRLGVLLVQAAAESESGDLLFSCSLLVRDARWADDALELDIAPEPEPEDDPEDEGLLGDDARWLFDDAPVGMVLLDLSGTVLEANRAFLKMVGIHGDQVVGRPFVDRIAKEDWDETNAQLSKLVMGTARAARLELRVPGPKDKASIASVTVTRIVDGEGDIRGLALHFIDTTEQKHLEEQFGQSQKMQAIGQLAGGVAHDFNNLLTAMIGFCDLLLERHGPGDPVFADVMQIKQNANRATNLVRQLLAFSRKSDLAPVELNPRDALADLSNLLSRLLGETVSLDIDVSPDIGAVVADAGQFDQVIINLAVNARDAMAGGGQLKIQAGNRKVEEAVSHGHDVMPPGDYVVIDVIDTGTGISKENLGRIFEPFFSTKEVGAGTGLGLSTVYGIVRQSGGFVFVESALGQGTTFSIFLPLVASDVASEEDSAKRKKPKVAIGPVTAAKAPKDADLTGYGNILLVEDEDAVRMFGSRALKNKGYRVLEAANGEQALEVIQGANGPIDLILSDVVMPGMDGHTLIRLVRQEHPGVKVILMSGYAEETLKEQIGRDEDVHFLGKPFTLKDLAAKVKAVMNE
ncbi:MAG: response regulator [Magnetovibrionaceae bacterium]